MEILFQLKRNINQKNIIGLFKFDEKCVLSINVFLNVITDRRAFISKTL